MATLASPGTAPRAARGWRLGKQVRKAVLLVHILAAGTWFGIDIAMGALVVTAIATESQSTKELAYRALDLVVVWPLLVSSVVSLASGVLLGLGTSYGLIRYWWVAVKLVLNLVLTTLVIVALRPGIAEAAEQARQSAGGAPMVIVASDLIFPPVVSTIALLVAFTLSVFKPWGRLGADSNHPPRLKGVPPQGGASAVSP